MRRLNDSDKEVMLKAVQSVGGCHHCALRFTGDRNPANYRDTHKIQRESLTEEELTLKSPEEMVSRLRSNVRSEKNSNELTAVTNTGDNAKLSENANGCSKDEEKISELPDAKRLKLSEPQGMNSQADGTQTAKNVAEDLKSGSGVCCLCLGILQEKLMVPWVHFVSDKIRNSGYDAEKYTLSLSLPISLTIRQHALWLHLEERLPDICCMEFSQDDVVPIKQIWKYIYPNLITIDGMEHEGGNYADFFIELVVTWPQDDNEMSKMADICPKEYADRAKKVHVYNMGVYSRQGVENSLAGVSREQFAAHYPVPPIQPTNTFNLDIRMTRTGFFIGGRYCKYSRNLPQTPWILKGERIVESSTEELIGDRVKEFLKADELRFLASGREDVDVRMLGNGRPFAFECVNAKKSKILESEFKELEQIINGSTKDVSVNSLAYVDKESIKRLKEGEDSKRKRYSALCVTREEHKVDQLKELLEPVVDLKIEQETPIRVLHRRSNAIREKTIHSLKVHPINPTMYKLELITSAGAYVKEFVHGDFNRTVPNVCTITGMQTDIIALDVEEVYLDWPNPGGKADTEANGNAI